jgi:hypothetical protein
MKFAIVTSNNYFSYLILSRLLIEYRNEIALVIESRGVSKGKSTAEVLWNVLRRSGIAGFAYKAGTALYGRALDIVARRLPGVERAFSPVSLADRLGCEVLAFSDPNSDPCLERVREVAPDLMFSVNVYQRLKQPLLAIPRLGIVNCHFGLLPHYRGMSPYMWAMARGEQEFGVTAHFMDTEFDTGDIIAQACLPIKPRDSAYAVYVRGCFAARTMLASIAGAAHCNGIPRRSQSRSEGSYFSLPDAHCVEAIRRHRHVLVRPSDLARTMYARLHNVRLP